MPELTIEQAPRTTAGVRPGRAAPTDGAVRLYAIAFDIDIEALRTAYGDPYNGAYGEHAYGEIKRVLERHGFTRQQGSVYFGDPQRINAVTCVLAAMDLSKSLPWFAAAVRDVRMLRIEEFNDQMPAVRQAAE